MEFETPKNNLDHALALIHESATDERYNMYAEGSGPLLLAEIDPEIRSSLEFHELIADYGWPSRFEDGHIEPVHSFESTEAFVDSLRGVAEPYLNNLNAIFRTTLSDEFAMSNIYGTKPPLHRAYAIAPNLFEGIRMLYEEFPPVTGHGLLTELIRSNSVVSEQLHKAFLILGRLVKATDLQSELKKLGDVDTTEEMLIVSAQTYLTT